MADLQRLAALVQAEQQGLLQPEQQAALNELRTRAQAKNQSLAGYIEPLLTIGTGAGAEIVSGFVGLAGLPFGGDVAANAVQRSQQGMTYQPKTEAGQRNLERIGGAFQKVADKVNPIAKGTVASLYGALPWTSQEDQDAAMEVMSGEGISGDLGDLVLDKTGSPALATLAHVFPGAAIEWAGLKGAGKIPGKQYEFGDIHGQAFGQKGIFGGIRAKGADLDAQAKAEKMLSEGASRDEIWQETGWFKDVDDKWKFEIDDSQANLLFDESTTTDPTMFADWIDESQARERGVPITQALKHDELFSQYPPTIARLKADQQGSARGSFSDGMVSVKDPWDLPNAGSETKSTVLHELQHAIQDREGFAEGGSPSDFDLDSARYRFLTKSVDDILDSVQSKVNRLADDPNTELFSKAEDYFKGLSDGTYELYEQGIISKKELATDYLLDIHPEYNSAYKELSTNKRLSSNPYNAYRRLAGEAEARNVQTRLNMTPEERRATPPWATLDVPENELIVRGNK